MANFFVVTANLALCRVVSIPVKQNTATGKDPGEIIDGQSGVYDINTYMGIIGYTKLTKGNKWYLYDKIPAGRRQ
jgi:hypothetical protein